MIQAVQNHALGEPPFDAIAATVAGRGWAVTPDFVPAPLLGELRREALALWEQGGFREAGVGRGAELRVRPEVRTDRVRWIDPCRCTPAQAAYLERLETLRRSFNQALYLGLFDFEGHLAVYPPGSYYRRHLDQFRGVELRTLTAILYLNEDWTAADGGQLRLYTDSADETRCEEILPMGGQLVTFLSDRFPHEVMLARRERVSITGWFKRRG